MKKMLRKVKAKLRRTFVADCPKCHNHFYGYHDYGENVCFSGPKGEKKNFRYVCHRCVSELKGAAQ